MRIIDVYDLLCDFYEESYKKEKANNKLLKDKIEKLEKEIEQKNILLELFAKYINH